MAHDSLARQSSDDPKGFASKQQARAANPLRSAWVDASAGSGKTKVLIDRVLRLLLAGVPASKILCLTFTKAAAANMAVRLTTELGKWATLPDTALQEKVHKLTGEVPEAEQLALARRLFAATLDSPGGLQFQTIHSFCQSLLARFPLEANVPVGFTVLEDRQSKAVLEQARRSLINDVTLHPHAELASAFTTLLEVFNGDQFTELEKELISHRDVFEAQLAAGHGPALARLYTVLGLSPDETEDDATALFCSGQTLDHEKLRAIATAMAADGTKTNIERGNALADWLAKDDHGRHLLLESSFIPIFLTKKKELQADICTTVFARNNPAMNEYLREVGKKLQTLLDRHKSIRNASLSRALIIYAASLLQRYHALKTERLALDFDDLITAASRLVTRQRASWVLYKLDGGIEHILVDEAQDTNDRQWNLIESLASDFFSGDGAGTYNPPRSMFAVGDYKQSIYSFQGADPDAFTRARQRLGKQLDAIKNPLENVSFNVSFRSTSAVLAAVDQVFFGSSARVGLLDYKEHISAEPQLPGQVDVWPIAPSDPPDITNPQHPRSKLAQLMAAQIKQWVQQGEPLPARGRAMEYGDFLVLVHKRGNFMPEFVRACKQIGVPVSGADRMIIDDQLAVKDLVAFASFLLLPEDDLTLATVLKGPFIGLTEENLFALAYNRNGASLISRLGQNDGTRHYAEWLAQWQRQTDRITPYTLLSALLAEPCPEDSRSGRRAIIARLGPEANDPLDELLSLALEYEQRNAPSLQGFLHWLKSGETEIKREMEQAGGLVRIMTVHGSKGLEAPVVFVASGTDYPNDKGDILIDPEKLAPPLLAHERDDESDAAKAWRLHKKQKERQEYHRLLYVALTRAEDRLIYAAWSRKNAKIDNDGRLELKKPPTTPAWYHLLLEGLPKSSEREFDFTPLGGWRGIGLQYSHDTGGKIRTEKNRHKQVHDFKVPLPDWATRPPEAEPSPTKPLMPSRIEDDSVALSPLESADGWRFRRGLLVHRLLQTLPELPAEQRRHLGKAWLGKQAPDAEVLLDEVLNVIEHKNYAVLFGPNSRAEVPVTALVGNKALSGQIDRLAVTSDTVWLVDYKTNRQRPASVDDVDTGYLHQLAAYRAALQPLYPQHQIRAILLWTDGPVLMEIPDNKLNFYTP